MGQAVYGGPGCGGGVGGVEVGVNFIAEALADGRAAHHDTNPVTDAALPGQLHHPAHLLHGGGEQGGAGDDVAVMLPGGLDKGLRGHIRPQVIDLDIAALQHDLHQILADVVHIAPDGTDTGRADGAADTAAVHQMGL